MPPEIFSIDRYAGAMPKYPPCMAFGGIVAVGIFQPTVEREAELRDHGCVMRRG
jgi:hypothetical protein